jgi:hypothetical protein
MWRRFVRPVSRNEITPTREKPDGRIDSRAGDVGLLVAENVVIQRVFAEEVV